MALITCKNCGKQLSDKATTCPHCGTPQTPASQQPAGKGKTIILGICTAIALALALFILLIPILLSTPSDDSSKGRITDDADEVALETQSPSSAPSYADVPAGSYQDDHSDAAASEPAWTPPPTLPPDLAAEFEANMPKAPCLVTLNVDCIENTAFNKYDVDILIDGEKIATLEHGKTGVYPETLEEGSHDVEFRINGKTIGGNDIYSPDDPDTFYTSSFTVSGSGTITYQVKLTAGNSISVEAL